MKKTVFNFIVAILLILPFSAMLFLYSLTPKIHLVGDREMVISANSKYLEKGAVANARKKDISGEIKIKGEVDSSKVGTYTVSYVVKKYSLIITETRTVKVIDDVSPTITLTNGENLNVCPKGEFVDPGFTAIDNYDGDITNKVVTKQDKDEITYTTEDSSHNIATAIRKLTRIDTEAPVITLSGYVSTNIVIGNKYYESGYKAIDNCDLDITNKVKVSNNVNTNQLGKYIIKYEVTDENGNTSNVSRTVNVVNPPAPKAPKNSTIYLTFDDGPSSITPLVLDILRDEGIKATFFVLNRSDSFNYLLTRMVNEGHTVGLHGNTHDYRKAYASVDAYFNDLSIIENKVMNVTGIDSKTIRFIGGSSNTVSRFNPGIMTKLAAEATARGYRYFDWNIGSIDTTNISSSQVYHNVIKYLGSKGTYVVLMHDSGGNYKTVNALRDIIRYGKNNGYKFNCITESTPQIVHNINN